jgi:hypothetical protein
MPTASAKCGVVYHFLNFAPEVIVLPWSPVSGIEASWLLEVTYKKITFMWWNN